MGKKQHQCNYKGCLDEKIFGRLDSARSWVFITSLASLADEITTVGTSPSWRKMIDPKFLARHWRERWGMLPSWWRLPIIGSFGGSGGRLNFLFPDFNFMKKLSNTARRMDARSKKGWKLSIRHDRKAIGVLIDIKESKWFLLFSRWSSIYICDYAFPKG